MERYESWIRPSPDYDRRVSHEPERKHSATAKSAIGGSPSQLILRLYIYPIFNAFIYFLFKLFGHAENFAATRTIVGDSQLMQRFLSAKHGL